MTRSADALAALRALPVRDAYRIAQGQTVLILAPHPDDEVLGCGGFILQALRAGLRVAVAFITDGTGSHPASRRYPPDALRALREAEAMAATAVLGVPPCDVHFLRSRDTQAPMEGPEFDAAVDWIVARGSEIGCGVVMAPWRHDPHCDHLATHRMAVRASARLGARHLAYPVWSWTLACDYELGDVATGGARLLLGDDEPAKRRALAAHASQLGQVIDDDPGGFALDAATLERMMQPYEVFLETP